MLPLVVSIAVSLLAAACEEQADVTGLRAATPEDRAEYERLIQSMPAFAGEYRVKVSQFAPQGTLTLLISREPAGAVRFDLIRKGDDSISGEMRVVSLDMARNASEPISSYGCRWSITISRRAGGAGCDLAEDRNFTEFNAFAALYRASSVVSVFEMNVNGEKARCFEKEGYLHYGEMCFSNAGEPVRLAATDALRSGSYSAELTSRVRAPVDFGELARPVIRGVRYPDAAPDRPVHVANLDLPPASLIDAALPDR